eukprot:UN01852
MMIFHILQTLAIEWTPLQDDQTLKSKPFTVVYFVYTSPGELKYHFFKAKISNHTR